MSFIQYFCFFIGCSFDHEIDVAFLLHSSEKGGQISFSNLKKFFKDAASLLCYGESKVKLGALRFGESAEIQFQLNNSYETLTDLNSEIDSIQFEAGGCALQSAFEQSQQLFEDGSRADAVKVIVLFIDSPAQDLDEAVSIAEKLKTEYNIKILILNLNIKSRMDINELASAPSDLFFYPVESYDMLEALTPVVVDVITSIENIPTSSTNIPTTVPETTSTEIIASTNTPTTTTPTNFTSTNGGINLLYTCII